MPESAGAAADFLAQTEKVAELLKLLGNPQRLMIACLLAEGELAVGEIESRLGIRQPSLSQQIGALREAGIIQGRREAKAVIYHLADGRAAALLTALHEIFCPAGPAGPAPARPRSAAEAATASGGSAPSAFRLSGVASFAQLQPSEAGRGGAA
ncbi:MAG: winged helix-turn-helix transcriptional regulator [Proteobacteria bacterium]|nr:winged helix-turn-helix transcriptional regulator [Pseudomonadota bacterium]